MNIYLYTVAKAASDYVAHQLIQPIAASLGLKHRDLERISFEQGRPFADVVADNRGLLKTDGNYFGALRHGAIGDHRHGPDDKVILHLRDPRDCLTSLYYSIVHSHPVPEGAGREAFLKFRADVSARTIDQQCLRQSIDYARVYDSYIKLCEETDHLLLSRYEDMVSDFENWLGRIFDFLEVPRSHHRFAQILDAANFQVDKEDVNRHMRRVVPGDFQEKLAAETIAALNERFSAALQRFDYPQQPPAYRIWKRRA